MSIVSNNCKVQGPPNNFFFLENVLKKTTEYFLKFLFLFECKILPVNNGNQFHSNGCLGWPCSNLVTIGPIFKHIIDYVQLYFTNFFHEYCPLKRQLSLAFRRITYL